MSLRRSVMTLCLWFVLTLNPAAQDAPAGFIFPAINPESATYANNDLYYADTSGRLINLTDSVAESENAAVWLPGGEAIIFSRNRAVGETAEGQVISATDFWQMPIAADGTHGEAVLLFDLMDKAGPVRVDRWLLSPDASTLYLERYGGGDLSRFDLSEGELWYFTVPDDHLFASLVGLEDEGTVLIYSYAICPEQGACDTGYAAIELASGRIISPFEWDANVIFRSESAGVTARYADDPDDFTLAWDDQTAVTLTGMTPSLSPDGVQIAYGVWDNEKEVNSLWLLDLSTPDQPRQIIQSRSSFLKFPSWSLDGAWLAFFGQNGNRFTLNLRDNDTGVVQTVHQGGFFRSLAPVRWRPAPG